MGTENEKKSSNLWHQKLQSPSKESLINLTGLPDLDFDFVLFKVFCDPEDCVEFLSLMLVFILRFERGRDHEPGYTRSESLSRFRLGLHCQDNRMAADDAPEMGIF